MKLKTNSLTKLALAALVAGTFGSTSLFAGTSPKAPAPVAPVKEEPFITGNLSIFYDTHFISYGQDVWGAGMDWSDSLIHPSLELDFNLGGGATFYVNTWWDVNDLGVTTIGSNIQEVDVNTGFYFVSGKFKFQIGYGAWMYGSQTEHIIDGKVSYNDGVINPFVAVHGRVADDIPFDTGVVGQVGFAPGTTLGPVALSFPVAVSFDTDNFHGGDAGFAYVSAGVSATIPLTKQISASLGVTYYHTNPDVIPNVDDDFVTGSAGFVVTF